MPKQSRNRFIVKVQIPLFSSAAEPVSVLVYNEDRSLQEMFDADGEQYDALLQLMEGEPKAFFWAHRSGKGVELDEPAPWQDW